MELENVDATEEKQVFFAASQSHKNTSAANRELCLVNKNEFCPQDKLKLNVSRLILLLLYLQRLK